MQIELRRDTTRERKLAAGPLDQLRRHEQIHPKRARSSVSLASSAAVINHSDYLNIRKLARALVLWSAAESRDGRAPKGLESRSGSAESAAFESESERPEHNQTINLAFIEHTHKQWHGQAQMKNGAGNFAPG